MGEYLFAWKDNIYFTQQHHEHDSISKDLQNMNCICYQRM